jgi:hypothetical protein
MSLSNNDVDCYAINKNCCIILSCVSVSKTVFIDSYIGLERTTQKTQPLVVDACLPLSCLATDFLYLRAFARRGPHRKHSFPSVVASIRVYRAVV